MSDRPFRHLCPEADLRDGMTDEEFWQHVAAHLSAPADDIDHPDYDHDIPVSLDAVPCQTCGEVGACGYDTEGRALIHTTEDSDE